MAEAFISIDLVVTRPSVLAWVRGTLVDISLAEETGITRHALAVNSVDIIVTSGAILTRCGRAFINIVFTVRPVEASRTVAMIATGKLK